MKIGMSNFALRHFKQGAGTVVGNLSPEEFITSINDKLEEWEIEEFIVELEDSIYPFCKYLIIENFTDAISSTEKITLENYQYLRSGYSARRDSELPYLSRWFDFPVKNTEPSKNLVLILYSREQLLEEHNGDQAQFESHEFEIPEDCEYGIVSMQALNEVVVEPMTPYTMVRNALGIKWGGNGEDINEDYLRTAAEYWNTHAIIK
jgi:hypothetical protein